MWRSALIFCVLTLFATAGVAGEMPTVRVAVLKVGTVNWELATIVRAGLDQKNGFRLQVVPYADNSATRIALQGGTADMAVADWIWVARQRASGNQYQFMPYSKAVGGLFVPEGSTATKLTDLAGQKIGIAGGPLDKSWLILRAYALQIHGFDLVSETEQVFGAPPLIYKSALRESFGGAINFWHFLAKMEAAGMRELISVDTAADAMGLSNDLPLLGYYFKDSFAAENPRLIQAFYNASRDAKELLKSSDQAWNAIRPMMNADTDEHFRFLKSGWIAGIPARAPIDMVAAQETLSMMHRIGGEALVGPATSLPEGLFADVR